MNAIIQFEYSENPRNTGNGRLVLVENNQETILAHCNVSQIDGFLKSLREYAGEYFDNSLMEI